MKPITVIKLGTASLTNDQGKIDESVLAHICDQLVQLSAHYRLILITSGAIGCGKSLLKKFTGTDAERRVAASVGNPILIGHYQKHLDKEGLLVAQALLERHHFSNRKAFLTLRETFEEWWKQGFLPIVNENDVVSDVEIRFSDNDELATLLAINFSAKKLLFGTGVDGVFDGDILLREIRSFTEDIFALAHGTSSLGLGGMISKLSCAKFATTMGTEVVIFNAKISGNILLAEQEKTGTICPAQYCKASLRQRWMVSGSIASGKIIVDDGASQALRNRKSLLAVGVVKIEGNFVKGELLEIFEEGQLNSIGMARAKISSEEFAQCSDKKGMEIAHANEIVIF